MYGDDVPVFKSIWGYCYDKITTNEGQPWADNNHSLTAGERGPVLLQDYDLLEKLAHFNRERIPERVVHAKGAGAKGKFVLTHDMSAYTKADLFNGVGKETPILLRFSQVAGEAGYPDTIRDVRGYALRFYTQEGNYDIVGNNTPVFFVNDPLKFPDFIHSQNVIHKLTVAAKTCSGTFGHTHQNPCTRSPISWATAVIPPAIAR